MECQLVYAIVPQEGKFEDQGCVREADRADAEVWVETVGGPARDMAAGRRHVRVPKPDHSDAIRSGLIIVHLSKKLFRECVFLYLWSLTRL
jgi:hypothetical protein